MRESAECRAFRKCFSILADGILDPGRLAVELYTRGWIGADLRTEAQKPEISERVKIDKVLSAVEGQLRVSPMKFRELLDILQQEPSLKHLAARLERSYHAELKVYQHPVQEVKAIYEHWPICSAAEWFPSKMYPCGGGTRCGKIHLCLEVVPQVG